MGMPCSPQSLAKSMTGPVHTEPTWKQGWMGMPLGPQNPSGIMNGSETCAENISMSAQTDMTTDTLRGPTGGLAILSQAQVFTSRCVLVANSGACLENEQLVAGQKSTCRPLDYMHLLLVAA